MDSSSTSETASNLATPSVSILSALQCWSGLSTSVNLEQLLQVLPPETILQIVECLAPPDRSLEALKQLSLVSHAFNRVVRPFLARSLTIDLDKPSSPPLLQALLSANKSKILDQEALFSVVQLRLGGLDSARMKSYGVRLKELPHLVDLELDIVGSAAIDLSWLSKLGKLKVLSVVKEEGSLQELLPFLCIFSKLTRIRRILVGGFSVTRRGYRGDGKYDRAPESEFTLTPLNDVAPLEHLEELHLVRGSGSREGHSHLARIFTSRSQIRKVRVIDWVERNSSGSNEPQLLPTLLTSIKSSLTSVNLALGNSQEFREVRDLGFVESLENLDLSNLSDLELDLSHGSSTELFDWLRDVKLLIETSTDPSPSLDLDSLYLRLDHVGSPQHFRATARAQGQLWYGNDPSVQQAINELESAATHESLCSAVRSVFDRFAETIAPALDNPQIDVGPQYTWQELAQVPAGVDH
ncbi:hypothetical protein JCM3765_005316 [Sporobolomyces pararoseus]